MTSSLHIRLTRGEARKIAELAAFHFPRPTGPGVNISAVVREALQSRWPGLIEYGPRPPDRTHRMLSCGVPKFAKKKPK